MIALLLLACAVGNKRPPQESGDSPPGDSPPGDSHSGDSHSGDSSPPDSRAEETGGPPVDEVCGDGVDANHDAIGGTCSLSQSAAFVTGATTGDSLGWAGLLPGDLDGDGQPDLLVSGIQNDEAGIDAGLVWLLRGPWTGRVSVSAATARLIAGAAGDQAGYALASAGDWDGDGAADLFVASPFSGDDTHGAITLISGTSAGDLSLSAEPSWTGAPDDRAGSALDARGDLTGDGQADLLIGANTGTGAGVASGLAYVLSAGADPGALTDSAARLFGGAAGDRAGRVVVAGDTDADGIGDVLVGAPDADGAVSNAGAAAVFLGPLTSDRAWADADALLLGAATGDRAGVGVAGGRDADGDGRADLAVGGNTADAAAADAGVVWVLSGPLSSGSLADAPARLEGGAAQDYAGWPIASAPDWTDDGRADWAIGAWGVDTAGADAGAVYLVAGGQTGVLALASSLAIWTGEVASDYAGFGLSVGDDGAIFIGAPMATGLAGRAYVLRGPF